jgi:WD40 repeat protein
MRQLTLHGHADAVLTLALSAKSELIVSSSSDCSIRVWDVATGTCIKIIWTKVPASCLDISSDAKVFVGNQFNDVCVWSTAPEESVWHVGQKSKKAKASSKRPVESVMLQNCIGHTADVLACKIRLCALADVSLLRCLRLCVCRGEGKSRLAFSAALDGTIRSILLFGSAHTCYLHSPHAICCADCGP